MDKRVIFAVAGSGKTYVLCNEIDIKKRNLVLAYTNENINNIYNEIIKSKGSIPQNTLIMTFDSFILNYIVKPYAKAIAFAKDKNFLFNDYGCAYGLDLPEHFNAELKTWNNNYKEDRLAHYVTKTGKFYGERLPKFVYKFDLTKIALIDINKHFDKIYIDEIQDFAGYRFDVLASLINGFNKILLVGDFYQHSVSTKIDIKKYPFVKTINYNHYKAIFKKFGLVIDETSLIKSRRCSKNICEYVNKKLGIKIESAEINSGKVIILEDKDDVAKIINDNNITKLLYQDASKCTFCAINWGYSKGDTCDSVCVILTKKLNKFIEDSYIYPSQDSIVTKNRLYVALTRTKGDLYILTNELYEAFKRT